ncbi:MAG TPA: SBBP repeat-containing protein [Pyrinomonadaceae bacterium]|nr:SBBP repeat-containing protein [Pyrinomonadaceae bacterium]
MKPDVCWTSRKSFLSLGLVLIASIWGATTWNRQLTNPDPSTKARLNEAYGQLPLSFEANVGQVDPRVDFISRGSGYTLFLTPREAVLALRAASASSPTGDDHQSTVVRMKFAGSETKPQAKAREELPGKVNYITGNDPKLWRTGISTYARVAYENVYPGVDLVYYGNQRQLEYDFVVHPGTDPTVIAINFEGVDQLKVDTQGELVLHTRGGEIRQRKPFIYQEVDGVRHEVAGSYKLKDANTVSFQLADYDANRPLVIDPVLVYSTFLGGAALDTGQDITVDAGGNVYVTGVTQQLTDPSNFPTTVGAFDTTHNGGFFDVYVTKLNSTGSALVYSTFLGGSDEDFGSGITVDSTGNAYVTGTTSSPDFPTTAGAFDTTYNTNRDAFVTKLNATGSALIYSTFLGGFESDGGNDIEVDPSGNAYVAGNTLSSSFPTTPGAFDTTHNVNEVFDVFVTKLNAGGSALIYSTFLGGTNGALAPGIDLDTSGSIYVTGFTTSADFPTTVGAFDTTHNGSSDVFVTKLNATASALIYSTFLGGSGTDTSGHIVIDTSGNAYVGGDTSSPNFPTTVGAFDTTYNGNFDAFVTKLNPSGSAPLVYSTFLGGTGQDHSSGIAVDISGSAYITGITLSADFPTVDAVDATYNGNIDAFVTKLNPSGSASHVYSTFLGGSEDDSGLGITVDVFGSAYVTGSTTSTNFPTTTGAFDTTHNGGSDAFVTKLSATATGVPATLTLNPPTATNTVDSQHCVTATVQDASGSLVGNVVVRFEVNGSVDTSGSATTGANGEATFCYVGPPLPGADTITAFADTNNNSVQEPGESFGMAEKTWVLPASTPRCEITNGGWIIAANGDRANFGGHAKASGSGETQGQQLYQDHGPAQPLKMHSLNVLAVVCDGSTRASIFGQATIDGSGVANYRINVQDLGGPSKGQDTYWLITDGYDSGEQILRGGNIQIRRR